MSGDRLGVRWGYAGGAALASIEQARDAARFAERAGFDSFWISHALGIHPIVALACVGPEVPGLKELGTSVVPLFGRHPIDLAQASLTAQSALNGRFTLGIGAGSKPQAEERMALSWDRPFSFTREFVDALEPLLTGREADIDGEQLSAHAQLGIAAPAPPILVAALGRRMLRFAGARTQGTSLGQCGPNTIANYIVPTLRAGAEAVGRPMPRIMALVRICVTNDPVGAYALAKEVSAFYHAFPSYAAVLDKEGLDHPADLHLIGSWQAILDGLAKYAESGVTDLRIEIAAHNADARVATREALANYLR
ncbi:MAG: 5,10-methylenetetrahydromethanopterin reductase [Gammaproteobacteria bacterium]|jgi:5,10-methylenetetrahydromethanopterin reductase